MKLWGGRFTKGTNSAVDDFHSSIRFDSRLYKQDITGSIAHANMLKKMNIIPTDDADRIIACLQEILEDIEAGNVEFSIQAEDIHMNVETLLIERIGDAGKRLHTGRSRNDQVALDSRMYTMMEVDEITALLKSLIGTLIEISENNLETIMPGYTHMQKAQPITLAFHMMAYVQMFIRDMDRLNDTKKRVNVMPLGSGALAGTTYPLDREYVAEQLGFDSITVNALDGVSDRDFVADILYACSMIMMHLSRFCEEVVLWATGEFSFIDLDDGFSTGSSIMPQKKNPDVAELIRGKTGRVYGDLMGILTVMKGLPLAYNKDTQEDKEGLFDGIDTVKGCISIMDSMMASASFNKESMRIKAANGFTNATDAADYLVYKGIPFRKAHEIIGKMVLTCINQNKSLGELTQDELKVFSPLIEEDFYKTIDPTTCVNKRDLVGGPAPSAVLQSIAKAKSLI